MIDLEKMAKEHEKLFERCDLESQLEKLIEEKNEVLKELVDVAIVCAGIYRFNQQEALRLMSRVYMACEILGFKMSDLEAEVNRKWQINLNRKWAWNGKTYHHVGDDEC